MKLDTCVKIRLMESERNPITPLLTMASIGLSMYLMNRLSIFAFVPHLRKQIKEDAHGICQTCLRNVGTNKLVASHKVHKTQNIKNGIAQCARCEAEHHIKYLKNPSAINMKKIDNDSNAWGHFLSLQQDEREYLHQIYPVEINYLIKQFS